MIDDDYAERLAQLEQRMERLERLAYVTFDDVRRVAEYAYQLAIRPPWQPGDRAIQRMPHMRPLSEAEASRDGLSVRHRIVMKSIWKALGFGIRHDVLAIAKELSERIMVRAGEDVSADNADQPRTPAGT